ncbi:MAG: hypothetical protein JO340_13585 [Acidobacteriaceae bacterium]|nr:hypothetical protein [Acidobacteriaceae bacterium]
MVTIDAFSKSFKNEILLQQAVAALLSRMPNTSGVQILQGAQEYGKDIVFHAPGGFGEPELNACVVKNCRITGECSASAGARTVLFQAQQAFDTPHIDENGNEIRVSKVYIITPYPIPPATVASISGSLKDLARRTVFLGGTTLFDRFKQYWPDFLAEEFRLLDSYATALRENVAANKDLQSLSMKYQLGSLDNSMFRNVYVKPNFHRFVHGFSARSLYSRTLPKMLGEYQGGADIDRWRDGLASISTFSQELLTWGLADKKATDQVRGRCKAIQLELERGWSQALATRAAKGRAVRQQSRSDLQIVNRADLNRSLVDLRNDLADALAALERRLSTLQELVNNVSSGSVEQLSTPEVKLSTVLDDLVRRIGPGFLQEENEARWIWADEAIQAVSGCIIVIAPAGFGKSSFCRWHALNDLEMLLTGGSKVLPVYVPLYQIKDIGKKTFRDAFLKFAGVSAFISPSGTEEQVEYDRIRVYLDGLDEATEKDRKRIVDLAVKSTQDDPRLQVIITSRDYVFGPWFASLPRVSLGGFTEEQARELATKWLKKSESLAVFIQQLDASPSIKQMMETPLLATLIILVFRQTGKLPENRTRLYEIFIDLHNGGWDLAKGVQRPTKFSATQKIFFLKRFAHSLQASNRRETVNDRASALAKVILTDVNWAELKQELLRDGLISEAGDMIGFSHQSYQEFLAAKDLLGHPDTSRANKYCEEYILGSDWWAESLRFYVDLASKPLETREWLLHRLEHCKKTARTISEEGMRKRVEILLDHLRASFPFARTCMERP